MDKQMVFKYFNQENLNHLDDDDIVDLLQEFFAEVNDQVLKLNDAHKQDDIDSQKYFLHRLLGTSKSYGFKFLIKETKELQKLLDNDLKVTSQQLRLMIEQLRDIAKDLSIKRIKGDQFF